VRRWDAIQAPGLHSVALGADGGKWYMDIEGEVLAIVASVGLGWDPVSVSLRHRCPRWDEMAEVKRVFFRPCETAMELHVPPAENISYHPFCLHLWRPQGAKIPRPPAVLVAPAPR
jgi:hypothetical protein